MENLQFIKEANNNGIDICTINGNGKILFPIENKVSFAVYMDNGKFYECGYENITHIKVSNGYTAFNTILHNDLIKEHWKYRKQ